MVENLDDSDQFNPWLDFVRNFDATVDLISGLIRITKPIRKYVKRPVNKKKLMRIKYHFFSDRKVKVPPRQAVVGKFSMRNLNPLSDSKQVCLIKDYEETPTRRNINCRTVQFTRKKYLVSKELMK